MKKSELRKALCEVLSAEAVSDMEKARVPLPRVVDMAALALFDRGAYSGETLRVVRCARLMLHDPGYFVFEKEQ